MRQPSEIEYCIAPLFNDTIYELVGVHIGHSGKGHHATSVVKVFIDKPGGITIGDITMMSRKISAYLDVEQKITNRYILEVSSPGLDRLLLKPEHFAQQLGNKLNISLVALKDNKRNIKGTLEKIEGNDIYLSIECDAQKEDNKHIEKLSFDEIDKARVIPQISFGKATVKTKERGVEKE